MYEQVLSTVGTAHEKNKRQKLLQDREIKQLKNQSESIEKQTSELQQEKQRCLEEIQKRRNEIA